MDDKQWEKFISLPEEYSQDSTLVDRAIAEIEARKAKEPTKVKKSWFSLHWKKVAVCAASLALAVGIGIPVYQKLTAPPPVVYYAANDLITDEVVDMGSFVREKELDIGFFNVATAQSRVGTLKKTGKVALVYQKLVYIGEQGFDQIELNVVLEENLTLDFHKQYSELVDVANVGDIVVNYKTVTTENNLQQIFAKFTHKNAEYYLDIITESPPTACIDTYVHILID